MYKVNYKLFILYVKRRKMKNKINRGIFFAYKFNNESHIFYYIIAIQETCCKVLGISKEMLLAFV